MKQTSLMLFSLMLLLILTACGGEKACAHQYQNDCDAVCDLCGKTRTELSHDYKAADCTTPKTCRVCGVTEGEALGHTAETDDGDCTTAVKCTACGEILLPAKIAHVPHADDGDCQSPVTCTACDTVTVVAKTHQYDGLWQSDGEGHWHLCQNAGCYAAEAKTDHTKGDDGKCRECGYTVDAHVCAYSGVSYDETGHWKACACGAADPEGQKVAHAAIDDGDCTTPVVCSCGYILKEAADHVAGEDDGNCMTPIPCQNCEQDAVAGTDGHTDADHDHVCDNEGCQMTLPGDPHEDGGIDLPIDKNEG